MNPAVHEDSVPGNQDLPSRIGSDCNDAQHDEETGIYAFERTQILFEMVDGEFGKQDPYQGCE